MKLGRISGWRRRWWIGLALVLVATAVVAAGMYDALRSREAYFRERRGVLVDGAVERGSMASSTLCTETVQVRSDSGLAVTFRVLRPANDNSPMPLVLLLGGHRTGRNAIDVIGDCGRVAVAALDYPYDGPEKIRGFVQAVRAIPKIRKALLDTPPAVSLALDWLIAQPWVDPGRVELIGVSLGTPFAAVAGACDDRFRRVWLIHGGADNRAWIDGTLRKRISSDAMRGFASRSILLLARGRNFETAEWVAKIAPRSVVVVGARDDASVSPASVEALHAAAGEPKLLLWTEGPHINPRKPELVRPLLDIVLQRL